MPNTVFSITASLSTTGTAGSSQLIEEGEEAREEKQRCCG
jgi:hypothetical protein